MSISIAIELSCCVARLTHINVLISIGYLQDVAKILVFSENKMDFNAILNVI